MTRARRLLVIGLDAATPSLVEQWVEGGKLPALAGLMSQGTWAPLLSVPNTFSPAAWSTFATGKNPGRHGIFFFTERIPGTHHQRIVNGSMRDGVPFWRLLDREGLRVGVMNVPMTYPAEPINGFMIAGFDAPNAYAPGFAYPPNLIADMERDLGKFGQSGSLSAAIGHYVLRGHIDRALEVLLERIEIRTRWAEHLMRKNPLDVLMVVHTEIDGAQHFFWRFMDERHPQYRPELARRYGDFILRVYQKADESVARLRQAFGGDATVMVLSDHGGGISPFPEGFTQGHFIRSFLRETGLLTSLDGQAGHGRVARRLYERLNPLLPFRVKSALKKWLPSTAARLRPGGAAGYKASGTRAYPSYDGVSINLRGREPRGIVEPGSEYEDLRTQIIRNLMACVDPMTGEKIVDRVYRREEIYHGPHADHAPDLAVKLREGVFSGFQIGTTRVVFPRVRPANPQEMISGVHRPYGILILAGEEIQPRARLLDPSLQDIAPTVLHALDCAVPDDLDGRILIEAFPSERANRPVRRVHIDEAPRAEHAFSQEDEAQVTERLRSLGYL